MWYRYQSGEQVYEIAMERLGETYRVTVAGQTYSCELLSSQPGQVSLRFGGRLMTLYWAVAGGEKWLSLDGCTYRLHRPVPRARREGETDGSVSVQAPMPAQVRAIEVGEGDIVEKGQLLLLLEAMKMEIRIKAPNAGRVARVLVRAGQTVDKEQKLFEMQPLEKPLQKPHDAPHQQPLLKKGG